MRRRLYGDIFAAAVLAAALTAAPLGLAAGLGVDIRVAMVVTVWAAVVLVMVPACLALARRVAGALAEPLNAMDWSQVGRWPELAPFVRRARAGQRHRAQSAQRLDQERAWTTTISRRVSDALLLISPDGTVVSANPSAAAMLAGGADLTGRHLAEITRRLEILTGVDRARSGVGSQTTLRLADHDVDVWFSPTPRGVMMTCHDITDQVQAARRRRQFADATSHQLRTPLTTITGYAEMLANGLIPPPDLPHAATAIQRAAVTLEAALDSLLRAWDPVATSQPAGSGSPDLVGWVSAPDTPGGATEPTDEQGRRPDQAS
jgi:two-component system phosphate regulon sensor histidine kinase PhoR